MADSNLVTAVKKLIAEHLDLIPNFDKDKTKEKLKASANLKTDLGFDDISMLEFVLVIEEQWGYDIPDEAIAKMVTVGDIATIIDKTSKGLPL